MSYPLSEACGNFLEGAVENYSQTVSIVIDSLFFIFSIFMIGLWVKTVVISPKTPSIEIADEAIEVPSGRVKHHGYVGEDGLWQLYTNGYLEFNGDDLYKYDEFVLPWDEYKDEIFYIKIDDSVRNIDERWFLNYKKLEAVYLPADLEFISEKAFQGCDNLGKQILIIAAKMEFCYQRIKRNCAPRRRASNLTGAKPVWKGLATHQ